LRLFLTFNSIFSCFFQKFFVLLHRRVEVYLKTKAKNMRKTLLVIVVFLLALPTGNVSNAQSDGYSQRSEIFSIKGVLFEMVFVEGGVFMMGCDTISDNCPEDELPHHAVTLPDFYIGKTEVTQLLWRTVMGTNPSSLVGDHLPVESVNWNDCQAFIKALNRLTGRKFSLPTEAQWEYASRGGNKSRGYRYSGSDNLDDVAWYKGNSGMRARKVADKAPNELGIHDMTGNVFEWCNDWYNSDYYSLSPEESPRGFARGTYRVFRGGSFRNDPQFLRVTHRNYNDPNRRWADLGLRLALEPE
jgi:formylglycine-generating enzyme required for sulfatase activity